MIELEDGEIPDSEEKASTDSSGNVQPGRRLGFYNPPGIDPVRINLEGSLNEVNDSIFVPGGQRKSVTFLSPTVEQDKSNVASGGMSQLHAERHERQSIMRQKAIDAETTRQRKIKHDMECMNKSYAALNDELNLLVRARDDQIAENQKLAQSLEAEKLRIKNEKQELQNVLQDYHEQCKQERKQIDSNLSDINIRVREEADEAESMRALRDEYHLEVERIQKKFNLCRIDMQSMEEKRDSRKQEVIQVEKELTSLKDTRDHQVRENEQVRDDIIKSNADMMANRDRAFSELATAQAKKIILDSYISDNEAELGAPNFQVNTTRVNHEYDTSDWLEPTDDVVHKTTSTPKGILRTSKVPECDPFVNNNANKHVADGKYDVNHTPQVPNVNVHNTAPVNPPNAVPPTAIHQGLSTVAGSPNPYNTYYGNMTYQADGRPTQSTRMRDVTMHNSSMVSNAGNVKPNRRTTMSASMHEIYDTNPCISGLGIDCYSRTMDAAQIMTWSKEQGNRLKGSKNPARRKARSMNPYDGTKPWKESYLDFLDMVECNGWTKEEALPELICWLKDGPGKLAVSQWREAYSGRGTFDQLVECAGYLFGTLVATDPMEAFHKRTQKPQEPFKVFGIELQDLLRKARPTWRLDDDFFMNELFSQFLKGLRDRDQQQAAYEGWTCNSSLADIFMAIDNHERKKRLTVGFIPQRMAPYRMLNDDSSERDHSDSGEEDEENINAIGPKGKYRGKFQPGKNKVNSKPRWDPDKDSKTSVSQITPIKDSTPIPSTAPKPTENASSGISESLIESLIKKIHEGFRNQRRPPLDKTRMRCYRCQKMGHLAAECMAERPIYMNTENSGKTEN